MPVNPIDLSKATNLKDIALISRFNPKWAAMALRTITSDHRNLQEISYNTSTLLTYKRDYPEWLELDRVFIKLWESHSIRTRVLWNSASLRETMTKCVVVKLLPNAMTRDG